MPRTGIASAQVGIYTYGGESKKYGGSAPHYEFDVSEFRDPMPKFKKEGLTGSAPAVQEWIKEDPRLQALIDQVMMIVRDQVVERKLSWLTIGLKDHHEKWIARALAEIIAQKLEPDYRVSLIFGVGP